MDIEWNQSELRGKSRWAKSRTGEQVLPSTENSYPFCVFRELRQIAFARVVLELVSADYIAEVRAEKFEPANGIGRWIPEQILTYRAVSVVKR